MPYNEGYFDIVNESSNENDQNVIDFSTEAYYNTITSGSPGETIRFVSVAFFVGAFTSMFGMYW